MLKTFKLDAKAKTLASKAKTKDEDLVIQSRGQDLRKIWRPRPDFEDKQHSLEAFQHTCSKRIMKIARKVKLRNETVSLSEILDEVF